MRHAVRQDGLEIAGDVAAESVAHLNRWRQVGRAVCQHAGEVLPRVPSPGEEHRDLATRHFRDHRRGEDPSALAHALLNLLLDLGVKGEGDRIQIVHGIVAGERVVTQAQFMLDSESRIQEAIAQWLEDAEDLALVEERRRGPWLEWKEVRDEI